MLQFVAVAVAVAVGVGVAVAVAVAVAVGVGVAVVAAAGVVIVVVVNSPPVKQLFSIIISLFICLQQQVKTLKTQHDNAVLRRTGLQEENKQLMDQVAALNTKEKQLSKV